MTAVPAGLAAPAPGTGERVPVPPSAMGTRLAVLTLLLLAIEIAARALCARIPSNALWGLGAMRFLDPATAWLSWIAMALAMMPPLARRGLGALESIGDALIGSRVAPWALAIVLGGLVAAMPDQTLFIGDHLVRQAETERVAMGGNYIAAMPLDRLLHYTLPVAFTAGLGPGAHVVELAFGVLETGLLALAAVALARVFGARGASAAVLVAIIACGGTLTMFTGLGKPASELCVLVVAMTAAAIATTRRRAAVLVTALLWMIALLVHRSAVLLAPVWIAALVVAWRFGRRDMTSRIVWGAAALLPIALLVLVGPRVLSIITRYDLPTHVGRAGGLVGRSPWTLRLPDILNLLLVMIPALPAAVWGLSRRAGGGATTQPDRAAWIVLLPALAFLPVLLLVQAQQGPFRDWDVYAPAAVALALPVGVVLARAVAEPSAWRWLAVPIVVLTCASSVQWLAHFHDVDRGLDRVRARLVEGGGSTDADRAVSWDFVGTRYSRLGRWSDAADALSHAAALAPHRRILLEWALSASRAGDARGAREVYRRLLTLDPDDAIAWAGVVGTSLRLGDEDEARRADEHVRRLDPAGPQARMLRTYLQHFPDLLPAPR